MDHTRSQSWLTYAAEMPATSEAQPVARWLSEG